MTGNPGFERVTDVQPARASRCSSTCHLLEMALVRIRYLHCTLWQVSAISCVPAAQLERETAILIFALENSTDEAVRSDRQDSTGCLSVVNVENGE